MQRRTAAALDLPPLSRQGARFAQVVGNTLMKESGRSQEQVRDLILAQVRAAQKAAGKDAKLPIEEARGCAGLMNTLAPPLPPPPLAACPRTRASRRLSMEYARHYERHSVLLAFV